MGKKKKIVLLLITFSTLSSYSQSLEWPEKNQVNDSIYSSLDKILQSEPIVLKRPSIFEEEGLVNYIEALCSKKRREKELNENLQQQKEAVRKFMQEHFVLHDETPILTFSNENEILEWGAKTEGKPEIHSFNLKGKDVLVLTYLWGSGMVRTTFDVFERNDNSWELFTSSTLYHLKRVIPVTIKVSEDSTTLLFSSPTEIIRKLKIVD